MLRTRLVLILTAFCCTLTPVAGLRAASPGSLSFTIVDRTGHAERAAFAVYEAGGPVFGDPHFAPADLKHLDDFLARLRNPKTDVEKALAGIAGPAFAAGQSPSDAATAVAGALNAAFERDQSALFASVAPVADTQALLQQRSVLSKYGDHRLFYLRLNRLLLENALPDQIVRLRPTGSYAADASARVVPGDYWIVATAQPVLRERVHVGGDGGSAVTLSAPDGLYLTFIGSPASVRRSVLLLFKPERDRAAVVAGLRRAEFLFAGVGMARPAAPDVPAALRLARDALPKLRAPPDSPAGRIAWFNARSAALRTILAWGNASDAAHLIDACACDSFSAKSATAANVGYLENRLGVIDRGTLAARARDPDPQWRNLAASVLHAYGSSIADNALPDIVSTAASPELAREAAWQLLNVPSPAATSAMRRLVTAPASFNTYPAYLYLLAYGDVSDWRRVAIHQLPYDLIIPLAYVLQYPHDAATILASLNKTDGGRTLADAVDTLPATQRTAEFSWLNAAIPGMPFIGSFAAADHSVAVALYSGDVGMFGEPWIPAILTATDDQLPQIAANFATGQYIGDSESQFDYLPQATLEPLMRKAVGATAMPFLDAYLAAHRVTTRESYYAGIDYPGGVERRPFAMRNHDKSSSLDGVVEMRPAFNNKALRIALRVHAAEFGYCGSMFGIGCGGDADNAPDQHKLLLDDARPFIGSVRIDRDGKSTEATFARHDAGWLIYDVPLDAGTLDNAYLSLTLNYLGAHPVLVYDLFATNYARELRILAGRAKAVDALARSRPGDPGPPLTAARFYAAMGQFDTAYDRFRASAGNTNDRTPWQEAAAMFAGAGLHERAAGVLRDEGAKYPHDVAATRDLAGELYQSGDYAGAVRASATVLLDEPGDANAQLLQAMSLYLSGDRTSAATVLSSFPGRRSPRVLPLWLLASETSNSDRSAAVLAEVATVAAAAREPYRSLLGILAGSGDIEATAAALTEPGDIVRAQTYLGYHYLFTHDDKKATAHFENALATQQTDTFEYRIAQAELASRRGFPWRLLGSFVVLLAIAAVALTVFLRRRRA